MKILSITSKMHYGSWSTFLGFVFNEQTFCAKKLKTRLEIWPRGSYAEGRILENITMKNSMNESSAWFVILHFLFLFSFFFVSFLKFIELVRGCLDFDALISTIGLIVLPAYNVICYVRYTHISDPGISCIDVDWWDFYFGALEAPPRTAQ